MIEKLLPNEENYLKSRRPLFVIGVGSVTYLHLRYHMPKAANVINDLIGDLVAKLNPIKMDLGFGNNVNIPLPSVGDIPVAPGVSTSQAKEFAETIKDIIKGGELPPSPGGSGRFGGLK